jgi:methylated-DNA-[protein]-cysteine S-methyltransferase
VSAVVYGIFETPFGLAVAWLDGKGTLVRFEFRSEPDHQSHVSGTARDDGAVRFVSQQVNEYSEGRRMQFDLPLAATGTPFQHEVWDALVEIPFGRTMTYGALAERVGRPAAARAVGRANATNPIALIVPCHRVIGADGGLTGYGGGLPVKRALLDFEQRQTAGADLRLF